MQKSSHCCVFFFQAEDGIRDGTVTGVQTCALPIFPAGKRPTTWAEFWDAKKFPGPRTLRAGVYGTGAYEEALLADGVPMDKLYPMDEIGRASCRERGEITGVVGSLK